PAGDFLDVLAVAEQAHALAPEDALGVAVLVTTIDGPQGVPKRRGRFRAAAPDRLAQCPALQHLFEHRVCCDPGGKEPSCLLDTIAARPYAEVSSQPFQVRQPDGSRLAVTGFAFHDDCARTLGIGELSMEALHLI